jgi:hypothetical protein
MMLYAAPINSRMIDSSASSSASLSGSGRRVTPSDSNSTTFVVLEHHIQHVGRIGECLVERNRVDDQTLVVTVLLPAVSTHIGRLADGIGKARVLANGQVSRAEATDTSGGGATEGVHQLNGQSSNMRSSYLVLRRRSCVVRITESISTRQMRTV